LPQHERQVLEEEGEAQREQELVVLGRPTVRLDDDSLHHDAEHEEERRRHRDRQVRVDAAPHEEPVGGVHRQHHHRPVGEVDDAEHAENQGQPAGDEPVHAAEQETADDGL
jgi:hypothetical protein